MSVTIRRFFPQRTPCPSCQSPDSWSYVSTSRSGSTQYRRCSCGRRFRVLMTAAEVADDNGVSSRIVLVGIARPP